MIDKDADDGCLDVPSSRCYWLIFIVNTAHICSICTIHFEVSEMNMMFVNFFFMPPEFLLVFPFLHFWDFTVFFTTASTSTPSANHGPSCLTWVILRELVFPTWYCRSFEMTELIFRLFKPDRFNEFYEFASSWCTFISYILSKYS